MPNVQILHFVVVAVVDVVDVVILVAAAVGPAFELVMQPNDRHQRQLHLMGMAASIVMVPYRDQGNVVDDHIVTVARVSS